MNSLDSLIAPVKQIAFDQREIKNNLNLTATGNAILSAIHKAYEDEAFRAAFQDWMKQERQAS